MFTKITLARKCECHGHHMDTLKQYTHRLARNFHGYLNGTEYEPQGSNYGYPFCFSAWVPEDLPQNGNIKVGTQFAMGDQNSTINDTYCADLIPPRLTFQAHMAPLDIKFNNSAKEAWVTFHGSW